MDLLLWCSYMYIAKWVEWVGRFIFKNLYIYSTYLICGDVSSLRVIRQAERKIVFNFKFKDAFYVILSMNEFTNFLSPKTCYWRGLLHYTFSQNYHKFVKVAVLLLRWAFLCYFFFRRMFMISIIIIEMKIIRYLIGWVLKN